MIVKTFKIFSLCDDFSEKKFPEKDPETGYTMYEEISELGDCDCYVKYTAMTFETQEEGKFSTDLIAAKLVELGADDKEIVLIHIDY